MLADLPIHEINAHAMHECYMCGWVHGYAADYITHTLQLGHVSRRARPLMHQTARYILYTGSLVDSILQSRMRHAGNERTGGKGNVESLSTEA